MQNVWICDWIRTPVGRVGGALASLRTDDLGALPLRELIRRHPHIVSEIDEVILGCANQAGEEIGMSPAWRPFLQGFPKPLPA